jgi:hypothetical protein
LGAPLPKTMKRLSQSLSLKVALLIAAILIAGFGILMTLNIRQEIEDKAIPPGIYEKMVHRK